MLFRPRRAAKEKQDLTIQPQPATSGGPRKTVKIDRPGYRVTKERDPETQQKALLFEVEYPEVADKVKPRHRFMSAYEQRVEPPDKNYQYLLFACEPYDTIGFKVPNHDVDKDQGRFFTNWDVVGKKFTLSLQFDDDELDLKSCKGYKTLPNGRRMSYFTNVPDQTTAELLQQQQFR